jgi:mersacidin/lichenicidin family type 2 lantibiotic
MPTGGHDEEEAMSSKEPSIRAWKDRQHRASLSMEAGAGLLESHAGLPGAELGEAELDLAVGGLLVGALSIETPTWKYSDGTPGWAIANALAVQYVVENID